MPPSPNIHAYEAIVPSGSEPLPLNVTTSGALPEIGVAEAVAVGGGLAGTLTATSTVAWVVAPALSVTSSIAVKLPAAEYMWVGFACDDVAPSPKVHA